MCNVAEWFNLYGDGAFSLLGWKFGGSRTYAIPGAQGVITEISREKATSYLPAGQIHSNRACGRPDKDSIFYDR